MNSIEIPIECKIPNLTGVDYEDLGITPPDEEIEYKPCTIFVDHIVGFYSYSENKGCLIQMVNGDGYYTNLEYEELKVLLK